MAKAIRKRSAKTTAWHAAALAYLQAYQTQHIEALCSLPELYAQIAAPHGLSIGLYHDGLRELVQAGKVRLHPFSGPRSALEGGECALIMNRDIMYYAERI